MALPVPQCLYRCVPAVELRVQRDSGERQMELLLCSVVLARLLGMGWRAVRAEEVGRNALGAAVPEERLVARRSPARS